MRRESNSPADAQDLSDVLRVAGAPAWAIYAWLTICTVVTLWEFVGIVSDGLRFLAGLFPGPALTVAGVASLGLALPLSCLYVLTNGKVPPLTKKRRPPVYHVGLRAGAAVLLVASITATCLAVVRVLRYDFRHAQPVEEDQLGVMVAQFGQGPDMRASARGRELSAFLARQLRREIDLLPGLAGRVTILSGGLAKSEDDARRMAERAGAALAVWGWISGDKTVAPMFTFTNVAYSEGGLEEAPLWYECEIVGEETSQTASLAVAKRTSGLLEFIVGMIYLKQGEYLGALVELHGAILLAEQAQEHTMSQHEARSLARTLAVYHAALGRSMAAQGWYQFASDEYLRAAEIDSEYAPSYVGLGNLAYTAGRCDDALEWYTEALRLAPPRQQAAVHYARGIAHFCLGEYEAAAADYALAVKGVDYSRPQAGLYHLALGTTLCRLGRLDEGHQYLLTAGALAAANDQGVADAASAEGALCGTPRGATALGTPRATAWDSLPDTPTPWPTPSGIPRPSATARHSTPTPMRLGE